MHNPMAITEHGRKFAMSDDFARAILPLKLKLLDGGMPEGDANGALICLTACVLSMDEQGRFNAYPGEDGLAKSVSEFSREHAADIQGVFNHSRKRLLELFDEEALTQ